jgi:hypothetical protein
LRVLIPAFIAWLKEIRLYMATKHCLVRMVERPVRVKFFESSRGKIVNGDSCQFQESQFEFIRVDFGILIALGNLQLLV